MENLKYARKNKPLLFYKYWLLHPLLQLLSLRICLSTFLASVVLRQNSYAQTVLTLRTLRLVETRLKAR